LGGQLVRRRSTLGLTQKQAAERLSVDPSTLAKWERGEREPRGIFLTRVKQFFKSESKKESEVACKTDCRICDVGGAGQYEAQPPSG
jgi:transcriptional regulator with XRE-family HTH domain